MPAVKIPVLQKIYSTVFPSTCVLCDSTSTTGVDLCRACFLSLPHNRHCCHCCALPLSTDSRAVAEDKPLLCGSCIDMKPSANAARVPFLYEAPTDFMVRQLKYHGSMKFGRLLGELLAQSVSQTNRPDLLVPVPQHHDRYLQRGFNHAALIAQTTGRRLSIKIDENLAIRADNRPPQSGLNAQARVKNMRNAFTVERDLSAMHVAIVDDVVTTGATTEALTRALLKAGCQTVSVWAFARTV